MTLIRTEPEADIERFKQTKLWVKNAPMTQSKDTCLVFPAMYAGHN